jgi:hypothetical protein
VEDVLAAAAAAADVVEDVLAAAAAADVVEDVLAAAAAAADVVEDVLAAAAAAAAVATGAEPAPPTAAPPAMLGELAVEGLLGAAAARMAARRFSHKGVSPPPAMLEEGRQDVVNLGEDDMLRVRIRKQQNKPTTPDNVADFLKYGFNFILNTF